MSVDIACSQVANLVSLLKSKCTSRNSVGGRVSSGVGGPSVVFEKNVANCNLDAPHETTHNMTQITSSYLHKGDILVFGITFSIGITAGLHCPLVD